MIRLTDIIKRNLNECVVATLHMNGETFLAKNRDRKYSPDIEIVHEIRNDIEMIYIHDKLTDWSEGMNEYGIGIINASLMVHYDEMEADIIAGKVDSDKDKKSLKPSYDGLKIRKALSYHKLSDTLRSIIEYDGNDHKEVGVKGITMVSNNKHSFTIELTSEHLPVIKKIDKPKVTVRTNHGIAYPDTGYTTGEKRKSSVSRMKTAQKELEKITNPDDILDVLAKQWNKDTFLNPYRRENPYKMYTTGQILMNLSNLEFTFRPDSEHSKFSGVKNKLPEGYEPKIKVKVLKPIF